MMVVDVVPGSAARQPPRSPDQTSRRLRLGIAAPLFFAAFLVSSAAPDTPPRRDPEEVMAEIYTAAIAAGTNAELILFIGRYPDHPLADRARLALAARNQPDSVARGGPDGDIIAAFDEARLDGSAGAVERFADRFRGHPLAAEIRRPIWQERN